MTDIQETDEGQEVEQVSLQDDIESALSEQTEETVAETVEETAEEVREALEAPAMWSQEYKDVFNEWGALDKGYEYQKAMHDLYGQTQAHVTQKEQEAAHFRKETEGWNGVFEPYQQFLMGNGLTPQDAARRGVGIMTNIANDPQKFALDILQRTNYDFASHGQDAPYVPPEVQELRKELDGFKQAQQQQLVQAQQREAYELNQQIQSFATGKDESGNLLHPHYSAVEQDMAQLVYGYRGMNQPIPSIPELYEIACKRNPELQAQAAAEKAAKETARKAKEAKKAITASTRVDGKPTGGEAQRTLKEEIAANLNAA